MVDGKATVLKPSIGRYGNNDSPVPRGSRWIEHVNAAQTEAEVDAVRRSINRGQPCGGEEWSAKVTRQLQLEHTFRPRGRPKKSREK